MGGSVFGLPEGTGESCPRLPFVTEQGMPFGDRTVRCAVGPVPNDGATGGSRGAVLAWARARLTSAVHRVTARRCELPAARRRQFRRRDRSVDGC